jgi:hypothetical protein
MMFDVRHIGEGDMSEIKCSVPGCQARPKVEVRLYDVYPDGTIFNQIDFTAPFLCGDHLSENEAGAKGERRPRGMTNYPFTNKEGALGFTIYDSLER